jgi:hypothetical protein
MKKKSDNQIILERNIKHLESMDILSLMTFMKNFVISDFEKKRNIVRQFQLLGYDDTPLQNLDEMRDTFESVYDREYRKIYAQVEEDYKSKNQ